MFSQDFSENPNQQWSMEFIANAETSFNDTDSFYPTFPQEELLTPALFCNSFPPASQTQCPTDITSEVGTPTSCGDLDEADTEIVKLRPGRKRKGDVVDREALRRDRMIRNRLAAQRSREKKKKESLSVEKENEKLRKNNTLLETRVQALEDSNKLLLQRLAEMSTNMMNMQAQLQGQYQSNQLCSSLFNGFGEPAELDVGVCSHSLSQQRKPLNMFQDHRFQLILTAELAQLFLLTWWTAHRFLMASFSQTWIPPNYFLPCLRNKFQLSSDHPSQTDLSCFSGSICSAFSIMPNSCPEVESSLANDVYPKWFPPRSD